MKNIQRVIFAVCLSLAVASPQGARADFGSAHLRASGYGSLASSYCSMSSDGRYTVFQSDSNTLVPSANNGEYQIFLYDRAYNSFSIASRSSAPGNAVADDTCDRPVITSDGKYVAFESLATNLNDSDQDGAKDIFVRNRDTSLTSLVSSDASGVAGNGNSAAVDISSDGRYAVFYSLASNLTADCNNGKLQVFLKDRTTGSITCISAPGGVQGDRDSNAGSPAISPDGRYVVFGSFSTNLAAGGRGVKGDVYLWDRNSSTLELISRGTDGNVLGSLVDATAAGPGSLSSDGRYVAFKVAGGASAYQIYIRDRQTAVTTIASSESNGTEGNGNSRDPKIDANGRYVVFYSESDNLDISAFLGGLFLKDRNDGSIVALDADAPPDTLPCISTDASTVSYSLYSTSWDLYQREQDSCSADPLKENPGICGCGVVDDPTDTDADGSPNCLDGCINDPAKQAAGVCGCGVADSDTDSDSTLDCNDQCPSDSAKVAPGSCGCGNVDADANSNNIIDCLKEQDIRAQLAAISASIRKIKFVTTKSKRQAMKTRVAAIKLLAADVRTLAQGSISTKKPINFARETNRTLGIVKKAYRYTDAAVATKVASARRAVKLLIAKIRIS